MPFVLFSLGVVFFFFFAIYNAHFNLVIELSVFLLTYFSSFHFYLSAFYISPLLFQCVFFCFDVLFHSIHIFLNFIYNAEQMLSEMFLSALVSVFYVNKYFISFLIFFLNPPEHRVVINLCN